MPKVTADELKEKVFHYALASKGKKITTIFPFTEINIAERKKFKHFRKKSILVEGKIDFDKTDNLSSEVEFNKVPNFIKRGLKRMFLHTERINKINWMGTTDKFPKVEFVGENKKEILDSILCYEKYLSNAAS